MARNYEIVDGWEQRQDGIRHLDVCDVDIAEDGRVYLVTRKDPAVLVYEPDGTFVASWGTNAFSVRPHSLTIAPDGSVYVVDELDQSIKVFSSDGESLRVIGPGVPSDTGVDASRPTYREVQETIKRSGPPFNHPTKVAFAPNGDFYVSDGYRNARIHRFSADGDLLHSWGEPGIGPGEFRLPHSVYVTDDGRVLVADREGDRIQVFDLMGAFLEEWTDVQRPTAITADADGTLYVTELPWRLGDYSWRNGPIKHDLPARLTVLEPNGAVIHRSVGDLVAPHGIAVDNLGHIYIAEVAHTFFGLFTPTIQKLRLV